MEQLVANANLIYKNSDVALEMKKRCVTKWEGFKETEDASGMLRQIRTADGKLVHPIICPCRHFCQPPLPKCGHSNS